MTKIMTLHKEKNSKKYEGVYSYEGKSDTTFGIRYYENGKKRTKTLGKKSDGWTLNKCSIERRKIMTELRLSGESGTTKRVRQERYTLNNLFEDYKLEKQGVHKNFRKTELTYEQHIKGRFGDTNIDNITTDDVYIFRGELLDKGLQNVTVNLQIGFLKTLFNVGIQNKIYNKSNPVNISRKNVLKVDNDRTRFLNIKEVNRLLDEIKNDTELLLFVHLSLSTGGRLNTIKSIKYKDVNFETNTIVLQDFKNISTYTGRINNTIKHKLLKRSVGKNKNDFVIDMTYRTIQNRLKKVMDTLFNIGLDKRDTKNRVVIHTLRHTFGSLLSIQGVSIYKIQKLMNHSSIEMTIRYSKLGKDNGRDEVDTLLNSFVLEPGNIDEF